MDAQKTTNSQSNPKKKESTRGITILDLKLYYRAIVTNTAWHWYKTDM
jgi:hypothetical protein